jgi:hypothetical protein
LTIALTAAVCSAGAVPAQAGFKWTTDMVRVPLSTACPGWGAFSDDYQCFAGADTSTSGGPGALLRGGGFYNGTGAGPLAVDGFFPASDRPLTDGFRCAR